MYFRSYIYIYIFTCGYAQPTTRPFQRMKQGRAAGLMTLRGVLSRLGPTM